MARQQTARLLVFERVVALAATSTFGGLPDHVLANVAQVATEVEVLDGEPIVAEGADESWMFVLLHGTADVIAGRTTVASLTPGAVIGELAVLDPAPRSATVRASARCHLLRIDHPALSEVMADHPALARGLTVTLARRLREANLRADTSTPS